MRVARSVIPAVMALVAAGCGVTAITVAHQADRGAVASVAPTFRLPSHQGGEVALPQGRVALVFYRGFW